MDPTPRQQRLKQIEATVETLQKFHSTIIALAFGSAVLSLILSLEQATQPIDRIPPIVLGVAFVSTIIPFYHGMSRYLFETYVAKADTLANGDVLPFLLDILAFIMMAGLFVGMSRELDTPFVFLILWSLLLSVDILWSILVWRLHDGAKPKWALNNAIWLAVAWTTWFSLPQVLDSGPGLLLSTVLAIGIVEVTRSIIDYHINWGFYFPWVNAEAGGDVTTEA